MLALLRRPKFADWVPVCGLSLLLIAVFLSGPSTTLALRYERDRVLDGEWWRLLGAHLVHADEVHLAWNLLGLWLVAWLFVREFTLRSWLLILLASTAAIDAGFLLLEPDLEWYVGSSGLLHGLMAAGLLAWLVRERDLLTSAIAVLFAGKLAWEQLAGPIPFTSATLTVPVVHAAHTFGAVGGLVCGGLIAWWRHRPPASL